MAGRPRKDFNIDEAEVSRLRNLGHSFQYIASLLQVSITKLKTWRKENNYVDPTLSKVIDQNSLNLAVYNYLDGHPDRGEVMTLLLFLELS